MFQTHSSKSSSIKSHKKSPSFSSHDTETSNPPPNAPDGGVWGSIMYNGEKSRKRNKVGCAFLVIPGLVMMGCPKDEKDAYAVWENVSRLVLVLLRIYRIY
mmetsp:Transcript_25055/g.37092  ORF Transcript_25055/g.37092 Transcript_25055/m.37092 type:complete len:101 (-) Transcript_25055:408-710(-)